MSTKKGEELRAMFGAKMAGIAAQRPAAMPQEAAPAADPKTAGVARLAGAATIPIGSIQADPDQPRETFEPEALERLAHSIRTKGVLQPIRVRWDQGRGAYLIIAGERRFRAAQMAGLASIPCVIHDGELSAAELLALQVTENALREDLNDVDQAKAYKTLMELNGWSGNQLAKELGIAQSMVSDALKLPTLPEPVQEMIARGDLPTSTGVKIAGISDPAEQVAVAEEIVANELNRDEAAKVIKARSGGAKSRGSKARKPARKTSDKFRSSDGTKFLAERVKGLDAASLLVALAEWMDRLRAETEKGGDRAEAA